MAFWKKWFLYLTLRAKKKKFDLKTEKKGRKNRKLFTVIRRFSDSGTTLFKDEWTPCFSK